MTRRHDRTRPNWTVRVKIWIEQKGRTVLGQGGFELLERLRTTGSLSEAARQMAMSYRHAWGLIQSMNEAAGTPLISGQVGGLRGGGSALTPVGELAMARFQMVRDRMIQTADSLDRIAPSHEFHRFGFTKSLFAAASLHEVLTQLTANFSASHPRVSIRSSFGASSEMADHILAGASADLFFSADERQMDRLQAAGTLAEDSRVDRLSNRLIFVCPRDSSLTIRGPKDILQSRIRRIALADPSAPIGNYTRQYLDSQGLYKAVLRRAVTLDNPRGVLAAVDNGQADAGIVYQSDMSAARASRLLYRVPARDCPPIRYPFAITRRSQHDRSIRSLWEFLQSDEASDKFESEGFVVLPPWRREHARN